MDDHPPAHPDLLRRLVLFGLASAPTYVLLHRCEGLELEVLGAMACLALRLAQPGAMWTCQVAGDSIRLFGPLPVLVGEPYLGASLSVFAGLCAAWPLRRAGVAAVLIGVLGLFAVGGLAVTFVALMEQAGEQDVPGLQPREALALTLVAIAQVAGPVLWLLLGWTSRRPRSRR